MLTGKQLRFLRSEAHHLQPIFQVGKGGVNDHMIKSINEAIETRELMKIAILNNNDDDKHEVANALAEGTGSELVQVIGRTIILYKESKDHKKIVLPTEKKTSGARKPQPMSTTKVSSKPFSRPFSKTSTKQAPKPKR